MVYMKISLIISALLTLVMGQSLLASDYDSGSLDKEFEAEFDVSDAIFAKAILNELQATSFSNNREYCGYLVLALDGTLAASVSTKGSVDGCLPENPPEEHLIVASYHTHGAFDYDTPAEFPSVADVEADGDEGVDGYISTPGGRLWYVDGVNLTVRQICGVGCMIQDPNFEVGLDGLIEESYSIDELRALESEIK
jgi:hypothetical protein